MFNVFQFIRQSRTKHLEKNSHIILSRVSHLPQIQCYVDMPHPWEPINTTLKEGEWAKQILILFLPVPICFVRDCLKVQTKLKVSSRISEEKKSNII